MENNQTPYEEARDGNRKLWLPLRILEEVGIVKNRSLLHLQCHFGLESLVWVRNGAIVTGVDLPILFSLRAQKES